MDCRTVCLTNPSNDQLVKDEGVQIFYSIWSQTKPIGIGENCENPSQSLPHNAAPTTRTYDWALIPLVGPCALPIHPTTNWWRVRGHKSFIAFDCRPSPLVLGQIVKIPHNPSLTMRLQRLEPMIGLWYHLSDRVPYQSIQRPIGEGWWGSNLL